jgi:hypothetical protein
MSSSPGNPTGDHGWFHENGFMGALGSGTKKNIMLVILPSETVFLGYL